MQLFNFSEWILKHFNLLIPDNYDSIFFKYDCSTPGDIYNIDTCQTWDYFYTNIINNLSQNNEGSKYDLVLTLHQLFSEYGLWEKLYYLLGKNFFLFFILECKIYFKWGQKTHILLPYSYKHKNPEKPLKCTDKFDCSSSVYSVGFEKNLDVQIHRILYSTTSRKVMKCLFPKKSPTLLKLDILSQDVGPEISKVNAFGVKQMKSLRTLIEHNPTSKDCRLIFDDIILAEENRVPVHKVILFLTKTIEAFVPYRLLFQKKILRKFLWNMQKFLRFTLKQKVTLGFVMNGIAENQDPLKRNTIAKILMWLINKILIKIIRSFFYVSLADKGHSFIFYKQQFWVDFQKMALNKMITEDRLLEVHETIDLNILKEIKFFPKLNGSGYRPLITKSKCDESENYKLKLCNVLLKQLIASKRKNIPNPSGELHSAWLNYIKTRNKTLPYYVKTDIKDAYGSILHNKLKTILQEWFDGIENDLTLLSFEFKGRWGKLETLQQFVNFPSSVGEKILIYKVGKDKVVSFNELKTHIFDYIDNIYVTFANKNYKVIKGLPQGGKLSAALCELYYTSFDKNYLSYLCNFDQGEILLRAVDDYIFISHNQGKIHHFLDVMSTGIPDYGVEIQNEKTITNLNKFIGTEFYCDSNVRFFGYNLDVNNGFITSDLKNYKDIDIQSSMTFNYLDKRILLQKMRSAITLKLHPLLFDRAYQSTRIILLNIHSASCVMALKFVATVKFLKFSNIVLEDKYLIFCITKATHSVATLVSRKSNKSVEYATGKKICLKSFILILGRKQYNPKVIRQLEIKASRLKVKSGRILRIIKTIVKIMPSSLSHD